MKKFSFLFIAIALLFTISCNKEEDTKTCDAEGDCFWAELDGTEYVGKFNQGTIFSFGTSGQVTINSLTNLLSTNDLFLITFPDPKIGKINFGSQDIIGTYTDSSGKNYSAKSGTIDVTVFDSTTKNIEGTFNGSFVNVDDPADEISVTDGSFKIILN